jgi:hypothetical protein
MQPTVLHIEFISFEDGIKPSEADNILHARLQAFTKLVSENHAAAKAICSGDNIQQEIVLTPALMDAEEPAGLFSGLRLFAIENYRNALDQAMNDYENLLKQQKILTTGFEALAIEQALDNVSKFICEKELILMYLRRYPLIKKHPEVSEDEKGQ